MNEYITHDDLVAFAARTVNLPSADAKAARERVNTLRDRLEKYIDAHPDFDLVKMLHAGSVAKGTALRTLNDMDVAVYVETADSSDEAALIRWLADRLREAYGDLLKPEQIQPGTHCVTVSFRSQGGLNVDVVPVLYEGEANDVGYLIAKDTGDRLKTSVRLHLDFIRKRKDEHPDDFAQLVRFVKWWAKLRKEEDSSFRFKSFMIELLVAKLAEQGLDLSAYPSALREIFAYMVRTRLSERIAFTDNYKLSALPGPTGAAIEIFDPVNAENNVAFRYTLADRERIAAAADQGLSAIIEASFASTKAQAIDCWRVVFGPSFRV